MKFQPITEGQTPLLRDIGTIRNNWGYFLAFGILLIILGGIAISSSFFTTIFSVIFLGVLLLISGVTQIIQSIWAHKWSGLFYSLLVGIISIIVGFLCIAKPAQSAVGLTLLISAYCLIGGLFRMIYSALLQFGQWGWVFFNGLITFILGLMITYEWPISGLWVIGLFVGIDILLTGWSWVLLAFSARQIGVKE